MSVENAGRWSDKFGTITRGVLAAAAREAQRLGSDHVGTEHLLLGIMSQQEGLAPATLRRFDVAPDGVRAAIARANLETRISELPQDELHLVESALGNREVVESLRRPVTEQAKSAASSAGSAYATVFPEHLLLSMLNISDSNAVSILSTLGVSGEEIRAQLADLVTGG